MMVVIIMPMLMTTTKICRSQRSDNIVLLVMVMEVAVVVAAMNATPVCRARPYPLVNETTAQGQVAVQALEGVQRQPLCLLGSGHLARACWAHGVQRGL